MQIVSIGRNYMSDPVTGKFRKIKQNKTKNKKQKTKKKKYCQFVIFWIRPEGSKG